MKVACKKKKKIAIQSCMYITVVFKYLLLVMTLVHISVVDKIFT